MGNALKLEGTADTLFQAKFSTSYCLLAQAACAILTLPAPSAPQQAQHSLPIHKLEYRESSTPHLRPQQGRSSNLCPGGGPQNLPNETPAV